MNEPRAVPEGFQLPWNCTRTLADVWREQAREQRKRDRQIVLEASYGAPQPTVTAAGRIAYAGYDETETQVKWVGK